MNDELAEYHRGKLAIPAAIKHVKPA